MLWRRKCVFLLMAIFIIDPCIRFLLSSTKNFPSKSWVIVGLRPIACGTWAYRGSALHGVFLRDPSPYLYKFWRKTTKNTKRLGWQAWPGIELSTSHLPVLRTQSHSHWWDFPSQRVHLLTNIWYFIDGTILPSFENDIIECCIRYLYQKWSTREMLHKKRV